MKISVVGAGIMGSGIAYASAVAGFATTMTNETTLEFPLRRAHEA